MFIPRKVSRPNDVTRRLAATRPEFVQESAVLQEDLKDKGKTTTGSSAASEELAALVHLALSKHRVWVNPGLISSDNGYVPLVRLIRESEGFTEMKPTPLESDIIRAVQKHLPNVLEARIFVSSPQKSVWHSLGSRSDTTGGYEIRRKDWQSLRSITAPLKKQDWDANTVYLEKLPARVRTAAAVYRFLLSLLNSRKYCPFDAIQDVKLAPPSDAGAESRRPFRGFAFVTLSSEDLVRQLADDWPWLSENRTAFLPEGIPGSASPDVTDAQRYGVRATTKARWEELRDEYLVYRTQLLDAVHEEERKFGTTIQPKFSLPVPDLPPSTSNGPTRSVGWLDYPRGCLVFARNIHTETNKTTLRRLFSSAIGASENVLDYVDFNKGMDSCFLRIGDHKEASTLVEHFHNNLLVQIDGLDAEGAPPSGPTKPIVVEFVGGKKEELYWEKVPEKTRRQAVQNASRLPGRGNAPAEIHSPPSKRRRKD